MEQSLPIPPEAETTPALNCSRGAAMLEAAISLPVFLLILLVGMECLRVASISVGTQFVASTAVRIAVLGSTASGPERASAIKTTIIEFAKVLGFTIPSDQICIAAGVNPDCAAGDDAGLPSQLVTISVQYQVPILFGLSSITVRGLAAGRNEPFISGG